jgi:hypothetical protein
MVLVGGRHIDDALRREGFMSWWLAPVKLRNCKIASQAAVKSY